MPSHVSAAGNGNGARAYYTNFFKLGAGARKQQTLPCPFHSDTKASLSVSLDTGMWTCHAGCGSGNLLEFRKLANDATRPKTNGSVPKANGHAPVSVKVKPQREAAPRGARVLVAAYTYTDASGVPKMRKLRFAPKTFTLERCEGDKWIETLLKDTPRPLYNLPRVLQAENIAWCEGEKDVDNLQALFAAAEMPQWAATTNYDGSSGTWKVEYDAAVRGKNVICLPDNDDAGRKHVATMARGCWLAGAATVGTLQLPGLEDKGDVTDYLEMNGGEALAALLMDEQAVEVYTDPIADLFVTAARMRVEAPAEVPWLLDGMLAPGMLTQLMGQPKQGKSTLVHHILLSLFTGQPFAERSTTLVKDVVYLTEMPRIDVLAELKTVDNIAAFEDHIHILPWHDAIRFDWHDVVASAVGFAMRIGAQLLIIDTFYVWAKMKDENNASEVIAALIPVQEAVGKQMAVLLESHERKTSGDIATANRGSNALTGATSVAISIKLPAIRPSEGNKTVRVIEILGRHGGQQFTIDLTSAGYKLCGKPTAVAAEKAQHDIFEALPCVPDEALTLKQIREKFPLLSRPVIQRALEKLAETKFVFIRKDGQGANKPKLYWSTEKDAAKKQRAAMTEQSRDEHREKFKKKKKPRKKAKY